MAKTRTIVAIDPATGARVTRRTARTYYAAIVCTLSSGAPYAYAWAGRADLAAAQLAKYQRCCPDGGARLALVTEDPWAEAPAARLRRIARSGCAGATWPQCDNPESAH